MKVISVEARGQPNAGWLAATLLYIHFGKWGQNVWFVYFGKWDTLSTLESGDRMSLYLNNSNETK